MQVLIIGSVNVAELVNGITKSSSRAANLRYKTYYFLSLLTETNDNYRMNQNNGSYRNLCSSELKKIMGNKDFYVVRGLLLDGTDPVIEVNKSWCTLNCSGSEGYCQGYRIKPKYQTGVLVFKTLSRKLAQAIKKASSRKLIGSSEVPDYDFLLNQFEMNTLAFDPRVYDYILNSGLNLLQRVTDDNRYQISLIYNITGRWLYFIESIVNGNIWTSVSSKNHRLSSSITNLPKALRPFLLCNGKPFVQIDIKSFHPYILTKIIQQSFITDQCIGFNLKTIYPELFNKLIDNGSTELGYYNESDNNYSDNVIDTSPNNTIRTSPYMWCNFFNDSEIESLRRYIESPFQMDFYLHLMELYQRGWGDSIDMSGSISRDKLKRSMMYVLFDDNLNHRNHNDYIKIFQTVYPGVDRWINQIHKMIGKRKFSYLMQRSESYLLLGIISKEFHQLYPAAPVFTIHDEILTTEGYVVELEGLIKRRLQEVIGVIPGCKIKKLAVDMSTDITSLNEVWSAIEPISNEKKYLKASAGVFKSNIARGSVFLRDPPKINR